MTDTTELFLWFLALVLLNSVVYFLIGAPIVWHVGRVVLAPAIPVFEFVKTMALWGGLLFILLGRWKVVGGCFLVFVLIHCAPEMLRIVFLG
jgi:hypothetical protein